MRAEEIPKAEIEKYLSFAMEIIKECGDSIIMKYYGKRKEISFKGEIDLVTNADKESEKFLIEKINSKFPEHQIICEEGSIINLNKHIYKWIIDPLDGTTNFTHDYPLFGISVALEADSKIIMGIVYDPLHKDLFYAIEGGGAYHNDKKIKVSMVKSLNKSLIATGFGYDIRYNPGKSIEYFAEMLMKTQAIRRDGSAALDLCYVACGRFDAFYELRLQPWDVAAGTLIVLEAGGKITNFRGNPCTIYDREIVASNALIHNEIIEVFKCIGY